MVGVGLAMLALGWLSAWRLWRGQSLDGVWAKAWVAMTFAGWVALVAGWYVTEIGRQPWLVSGVLTTAQSAWAVTAPNIALTLAMYLTLYAALLVAYVSVLFYLARGKSAPTATSPMEVQHV
jgi:cytochrome d ubiquinol oxidase subunit I